MATTQIQYRRGTGAQNDAFTGALGEITVDTTNKTMRVHDGVTAGGNTVVTTYATQTLINKTINSPTIGGAATVTSTITGNLSPTTSNTYTLGSTTAWWSKLFSVAATAQYADLAENYTSDLEYPPGTVLVFGGQKEVMQSHSSHDTRIAGVVSTNPAYLMNATQDGEHILPLALQGRVPCYVLGPVEQGDRVVSSHIPGVAQRLDPQQYQPGCIIGKALQAIDSAEILVIEVVVGRV